MRMALEAVHCVYIPLTFAFIWFPPFTIVYGQQKVYNFFFQQALRLSTCSIYVLMPNE